MSTEQEACTWTRNLDDDSGMYETSCGEAFMISDGTPKENSFKFCCYCGKSLEEDHWSDELGESP